MFNSVVVSNNYSFKEDFLLTHKTYGAYLDGHIISDDKYPKEITIIIKNEQELLEKFDSFPDVNFCEKMVCIHGFTATVNDDYYLDEVILENNSLIINYGNKKTNKKKPPENSKPDTKWFIVILDRIEVDNAKFSYLGYIN